MGGYGDVQLLNDDGSRLDGRKVDEMRPVSIEAGVLPAADGSAMVTHGLNVAVAAVYGPMEAHPRKIQRQDRAVIDVRYNMAPFSTSDRIRPGFNRRSREISKVTAEALESVFILPEGPVAEFAGTDVRIEAREHIRRKGGHRTLRGRRKRLDGRRIFTVHPVSGLEVTGLTHEDHQRDEQHGSAGREGRGCAGHEPKKNVEDQEGLTLS